MKEPLSLNGASATITTASATGISTSSKGRRKYSRKLSRSISSADQSNITTTQPFLVLVALLAVALLIQFFIVFHWHHGELHDIHVLGKVDPHLGLSNNNNNSNKVESSLNLPHLSPQMPPLPPFLNTESFPPSQRSQLISSTLNGHPTIAGITLLLADFLSALHQSNHQLAQRQPPHRAQRDDVHAAFLNLAEKHIRPFEDAYRDKPIFPTREDDSIFVSLASFRDYLLGDTLMGAFDQAAHPERLYIGAVVQNCFGLDPYPGAHESEKVQCRTGAQVVSHENGHDQTKVSDAPPDRNGIEEFCTHDDYKKYCDNGQIRVLYLHENESLGPAMARYYASKLWGGETYFMQVDSHLLFYDHWDRLYIEELKATKSFQQNDKKAVLSSYPPGFTQENKGKLIEEHASPGARLCSCEFSTSDVESQIIRINTGSSYHGNEEHPTQIPFVAAGFFFVRSEFLVDVPFDPYMPWCFMGEEIMLSMRAWTHGWDIYAPRKNWISHQYRPGRMGLPKFWGSVGRLFGRPGPNFSNQLQLRLIKRVKHMVGYECCTRDKLESEGDGMVLVEVDHYGFGDKRSREEYLKWAKIDVPAKRCRNIGWCNKGELE